MEVLQVDNRHRSEPETSGGQVKLGSAERSDQRTRNRPVCGGGRAERRNGVEQSRPRFLLVGPRDAQHARSTAHAVERLVAVQQQPSQRRRLSLLLDISLATVQQPFVRVSSRSERSGIPLA